MFVPEQTGPTLRTEAPACFLRGRIPLQPVPVVPNRDFAARGGGIGREVPIKPPALATVAIDDIAQPTIHLEADRAAETAAGARYVSRGPLDHGGYSQGGDHVGVTLTLPRLASETIRERSTWFMPPW